MGPVIVVMGPTGSGKSLQAKLIVEKKGYAYVSTGDLLRASDDPKIKQLLSQGKLAESADIEAMLKSKLDQVKPGQGVVLDGCLRILRDAQWLDNYLVDRGGVNVKAIYLNITPELAITRIHGRKRSDDSDQLFEQKWKDYHSMTMPVIDYFRQKGVLTEIDGSQSIETIYRQIEAAL